MPPKAGGKEKAMETDEVLQAVVIAESFNARFQPLTARKPRCLLPMCNAPLLDWTFESLAVAGVQEVFVMCQSHFEMIETAIQKSKWSQPGSPLTIHAMILPPSVRSFGDAIRQVDAQSIIKGDFVLVSGDMVCNVRIDDIVKVHKERRKVDKEVIMTMLVKEAAVNHRTRPKGETAVFTLDAETDECLHYEGVPAIPKLQKTEVPRELLKNRELSIRYDLIDCGIDVCSADVPLLFQENFHSDDLRRDFVNEILTSDLLDKKIYCYFAGDGYAARVRDPRTYAAVSQDILGRWCFPLVPDDNHPGGHQYEHLPGNRYLAKDRVILSRNCKIGNNVLIGAGSRLNDTAKIENSTVGENCILEGGSVIKNSYLWDNVHIGAGCIIKESILGTGVILETGAVVERGCLIEDGVLVRAHARVPEFSKLSKRADGDQTDRQAEEEEESGDESDDDEFESAENLRYLRLGGPGEELSDSETEIEDSSDDEKQSVASDDANVGEESDPWASLHWKDEFGKESYQTLKRFVDENLAVKDVGIELKTLRMATNSDINRVKHMVIAFSLKQLQVVKGNPPEQRRLALSLYQRWGGLIKDLCQDEMAEAILRLQKICAETEYQSCFGSIVSAWYQLDIIDEDEIKEWHESPESRGPSKEMADLWNVGKLILDHLAEESDEETSEEEEEEEEESDGEEEEEEVKKPATAAQPKPATSSKKEKEESDDDDDDDEDEDEDEEEEDEEEEA